MDVMRGAILVVSFTALDVEDDFISPELSPC